MRLVRRLRQRQYKKSYAQCGEDLIVEFVLDSLHLRVLSYLDIGAHHPTRFSNTYLFYEKGSRGICVEPDPVLCVQFKRARPRDICLNAGVGIHAADQADFYVMSTRTLNTFSRIEAERFESYGRQRIEKVIQIPLIPINALLEQYSNSLPNFVSLDTEGLDEAILRTFDFTRFRPEVFCVETLTYAEDGSEHKIETIDDVMRANGYRPYADTHINTIFIDQQAWGQRR